MVRCVDPSKSAVDQHVDPNEITIIHYTDSTETATVRYVPLRDSCKEQSTRTGNNITSFGSDEERGVRLSHFANEV